MKIAAYTKKDRKNCLYENVRVFHLLLVEHIGRNKGPPCMFLFRIKAPFILLAKIYRLSTFIRSFENFLNTN